MAHWRALAMLHVRVSDHLEPRIVKEGEEFLSNDTPGRNWFPLDDEARAAFEAQHGRSAVDRKDLFRMSVTKIDG